MDSIDRVRQRNLIKDGLHSLYLFISYGSFTCNVDFVLDAGCDCYDSHLHEDTNIFAGIIGKYR